MTDPKFQTGPEIKVSRLTPFPFRRPAGVVVERVPALVVRPMPPPPAGRGPRADELAAKLRDERPVVVIVMLDRRALEALLARLFVRQFGAGSDFDIEVSRVASPSEVVYRSGLPFSAGRRARPDAEVTLFALGPPPMPPSHPANAELREGPHPPAGAWRLLVSHHAGSLETAVHATRARHIALAGGVLALLAASITVLFVSAQRAQRIARREVELVAGITHELRTPLAAIRSAGQNLADGVVADPGRVREYGEMVLREGRRLSGLVEQALAHAGVAARGDGQRLSSRDGAVSLPQILDQAIAAAALAAPDTGHASTMEYDVPADLPPARGDALELRALFENLLANAAKYAAGARVTVRARVRADARSEESRLVVTVADRGPGIEAADLPHVFESFYRGRSTASGSIPGSGLGLALVRRIAEAHGGSVRLDSTPGRGAEFTVELPTAAAPAAAADPPRDSAP